METYTKKSSTIGVKTIVPETPEVKSFEVEETVEQIEADILGLTTALAKGSEQKVIDEATLAQRQKDLADLKKAGVISVAEQAEIDKVEAERIAEEARIEAERVAEEDKLAAEEAENNKEE